MFDFLTKELSVWRGILIGVVFVAIQAAALHILGRPPICTCGYIKLWEGAVLSSGNSQHITDWYTFSHITTGFLIYLILWALFPSMSIGLRFALAVGFESTWEILENTPFVINKYREQALQQGYNGDSIINSLSDTFAMSFGFLLARKLPIWSVAALGITFELFTGYLIRDGLALNILGFIHHFPAIDAWQREVHPSPVFVH